MRHGVGHGTSQPVRMFLSSLLALHGSMFAPFRIFLSFVLRCMEFLYLQTKIENSEVYHHPHGLDRVPRVSCWLGWNKFFCREILCLVHHVTYGPSAKKHGFYMDCLTKTQFIQFDGNFETARGSYSFISYAATFRYSFKRIPRLSVQYYFLLPSYQSLRRPDT